MEKVKKTRLSKIYWRIGERLCEGLKLEQQARKLQRRYHKGFDLLHSSEKVCVSEPSVIERKFVTSRLRL
jgi:hypothetical protein